MDRQAYEEFIKLIDDMEIGQMSFLTGTDKEKMAEEVKKEVDNAKLLGSQNERRIALETLLENLIEIGLILTPEQLNLADLAFGEKSANEQISLTYYRKHLVRPK